MGLLRFLPLLKVAKPYLIGVVALSVLGVFGYVKVLKNNVSELEGQVILYEDQLDRAVSANEGNLDTIETLTSANESLSKAIKVAEDVRVEAILAAAARELKARLTLDDTLQTLEELQNESPSCNEIMQIDIGAACPLSFEFLRKRATPDN